MTSFHDRKAARTKKFQEAAGLPMVTCSACCGSGRYDSFNSPKCGCCEGTGKVRSRYRRDDPRFYDVGKL